MITIAFILALIALATLIYINQKSQELPIEIIEITYSNEHLIWLNLVNNHRLEMGLNALTPIQHLHERAQEVLSKIPPVRHYWDGVSNEIVGGGHATITALFSHFLNSQGHRDIIEKEDLSYIGIGIKKFEGKYYNVTIFK